MHSQHIWSELGLNVTLRLGLPPEDDIVYAVQDHTFITSGGGFSRTIGKLASITVRTKGDLGSPKIAVVACRVVLCIVDRTIRI